MNEVIEIHCFESAKKFEDMYNLFEQNESEFRFMVETYNNFYEGFFKSIDTIFNDKFDVTDSRSKVALTYEILDFYFKSAVWFSADNGIKTSEFYLLKKYIYSFIDYQIFEDESEKINKKLFDLKDKLFSIEIIPDCRIPFVQYFHELLGYKKNTYDESFFRFYDSKTESWDYDGLRNPADEYQPAVTKYSELIKELIKHGADPNYLL